MKRKIAKARRPEKEKSLLRKFIEVAWEQAQRRKALKILARQEWSVDFLTYLLIKASKIRQQSLELIVTDSDGKTITIRSNDPKLRTPTILDAADDIYNHLDEPDVVDEYIRRNGH